MKVVFVCSGNTCRSPMAEHLLRDRLNERGLSGIEVTSAGVAATEGRPAAAEALKILRDHGIESIHSHQSRPITDVEINENDLVLTMTRGHMKKLDYLNNQPEVYTLREYVGKTGNISDPYGRGEDAYVSVFNELSTLTETVTDRLEEELKPE